MKVITIAALLLGTPLCTTAQQQKTITPADEYVAQIIQNLISPPQLANKTTQAVKERLIGESVWQFTTDTITGVQVATAIDTTWYAYTGSRGSYWVPQYTTLDYLLDSRSTILADVRVSRNLADPGFDSTYNTYNVDNNITTKFYYGRFPGYAYQMFVVNDYDINGHLATQTTYTSDTRDTTVSERHLVYNTARMLIIDSTLYNSQFSGSQNSKYVYSYGSGGSISIIAHYVSSPAVPVNWSLENNYVVDYYDFGNIQKLTWGTAPHINVDSFGWTPDHKTLNFRSYINAHSWPNKLFIINHINAENNMIDTSFRYNQDIFTGDTTNMWRLVYVYNDYNSLVAVKQFGDATPFVFNNDQTFQNNYYYEKYDTTKNPAAGAVVITVYPVPVTSTLNILFTGITQATPFSLRLIDMAGRVAVKSDVLYTTVPIEILMSNLASGVYILEAISSDTHQRYIEKVVKY